MSSKCLLEGSSSSIKSVLTMTSSCFLRRHSPIQLLQIKAFEFYNEIFDDLSHPKLKNKSMEIHSDDLGKLIKAALLKNCDIIKSRRKQNISFALKDIRKKQLTKQMEQRMNKNVKIRKQQYHIRQENKNGNSQQIISFNFSNRSQNLLKHSINEESRPSTSIRHQKRQISRKKQNIDTLNFVKNERKREEKEESDIHFLFEKDMEQLRMKIREIDNLINKKPIIRRKYRILS